MKTPEPFRSLDDALYDSLPVTYRMMQKTRPSSRIFKMAGCSKLNTKQYLLFASERPISKMGVPPISSRSQS